MDTTISEPTFDLALNGLATAFTAFFVLGFLTTFFLIFQFARFIYTYAFQSSSLPRYLHGRKYYAWALVTGASDGIGLAFVQHLAARGFNVVLAGRNATKLASKIDRLKKQYPQASFRSVTADAASSHGMKAAIEKLVADLTGLDDPLPGPLTVLVNNVGGMSMFEDPWRALASTSHADVDAIINLNLRFTTQITRALLPAMQQQAPAVVLSVGSFAGSTGTPFVATYSGTKAYLRSWSQAMAFEMIAEGKDVEFFCPIVGLTCGTSAYRVETPPDFMTQDAGQVAGAALDRVGCGRFAVAAHWKHALMLAVLGLLPDAVLRAIYPQASVAEKEKQRVRREGAKKRL